MFVLACFRHWYESAIFFVPVVGVSGWAFFSSRKAARHDDPTDHTAAPVA